MNVKVLLLALLVACRGKGGDRRAAGSAARGTGDPWAVTSAHRADDPPSLADRHRLAEQTCPKVTAPYFYRVEKDGKVNYLLGTRHIGVPLAKFPPIVAFTLRHASLAVFELAPNDKSSSFSPRIELPDALGPKLWKKYRALAGAHLAARMKYAPPMIAVLMLATMYDDLGAMLERDLEHVANDAHIPIRGLETKTFQDELLEKLMNVRLLRAMLADTKDRAELEQSTVKALSRYCAGADVPAGFDAHDRKEMRDAGYSEAEIDHFDDELLFSRNAKWIPELAGLFARGGVFVAVGAGHLRGPRGVPALLAARGFTVTRITRPAAGSASPPE